MLYRRNNYRGKNITELWQSEKLYEQINACTFDDIYVGDYIIGNNNVTWLIADLNNYRYSGDKGEISEGKCHATIIPASYLKTARMNPTNTTGVIEGLTEDMVGYGKGGYLGSEMKNKTLPEVLETIVKPDFGNHILTYQNLLSNKIDDGHSNQYGQNGGAASDWEWVSSQIDLMSEVNVYGTTVWSSGGFDIGIDNRQYAIFQLRPDLINTDGNGNKYWYWLKAVTDSTRFARVFTAGDTNSRTASYDAGGIRPRFLIG